MHALKMRLVPGAHQAHLSRPRPLRFGQRGEQFAELGQVLQRGGGLFCLFEHAEVAAARLEIGNDALRVGRAHAGQKLQHAKGRHRVARVVRPAQHRQHVLHVRGLEELEAAILDERNLAAQQLDFEDVAGAGIAEQDRLLAQQHARFAALQDLAADELGLRLQVIGRRVLRTSAGAPNREQVLAMLARGIGHQRIRHIEDRLRGAVVLRQRDDLGLRRVRIGKAEDVLDGRAAERVDRLRVIADHGDAGAVGPQTLQDLALQAVRVLVFIDEHVVEVGGDMLRELRLVHQRVPVDQQVVVVEQAVALLALHVGAAQLGQVLLPVQAPVELLLERVVQALLRIDAPRIDRQAGVLARKALVLLGVAQFLAQVVEEVSRIASVDDGEAGFEVHLPTVMAQQAVADRVKGAGPDQPLQHGLGAVAQRVIERLAQDVVRAPPHLGRRPARKGQQQDARGIHAVHDEPRHAMRNRVGFSGAGAGHDQQRARAHALPVGQRLPVGDGLALRRIERG